MGVHRDGPGGSAGPKALTTPGRLVVVAAVLATFVSVVFASIHVVLTNPKLPIAPLAFELVIVVGAIVALVVARPGRSAAAQPMGLLCGSMTVAIAALLGLVARGAQLGSTVNVGVAGARLIAAGAIALVAAHLVLSSHPRAWPALRRGIWLGVPVVLVAVAATWPAARHAMLVPWLHPIGRAIVLSTAVAVLLGLFTASVHWVITAFELGRSARSHDEGGADPIGH